MKVSEIAKITIKRLFECMCCHTHVDSLSVGILGDDIVVCKDCAERVRVKGNALLSTFKLINKREPTDIELSELKKMSLNVQVIKEVIPCTPVSSVE